MPRNKICDLTGDPCDAFGCLEVVFDGWYFDYVPPLEPMGVDCPLDTKRMVDLLVGAEGHA